MVWCAVMGQTARGRPSGNSPWDPDSARQWCGSANSAGGSLLTGGSANSVSFEESQNFRCLRISKKENINVNLFLIILRRILILRHYNVLLTRGVARISVRRGPSFQGA